MIKRHSFMIYTIYYLFGNFIKEGLSNAIRVKHEEMILAHLKTFTKLPFYLLYILSQSYRWILTSIFSSLITIDQILTGILGEFSRYFAVIKGNFRRSCYSYQTCRS